MTYNSTIALDQITQAQEDKEETANALFAAASPAALFGIKTSATSGLTFTLYGGNMNIAGVPTAIATQAVTLTASTTNYIYATSAGVVTKATSPPASWPGPLASSAIALYQLVVGAATITSGTCYLVGVGAQGATGPTGGTGASGSTFEDTRKRLWTAIGDGNTTASVMGFNNATLTGASASARSLAASSLRESIPYLGYESGASAGVSAQIQSAQSFCWLGDAADLGGFKCGFRFCMESALSPATQRSFVGLFVPVTIGNIEPSAMVSMVGVGADAGDANFSIMHNDSAGAATEVALGANFPARATDNVYELVLESVANSGTVSYSLTNCNSGNVATGTINSNLPATTDFLSWVVWTNNGSTASKAAIGLAQVVGQTRY